MIQMLNITKGVVRQPQDLNKRSNKILPDKDLEASEFLNDQLVKDLVNTKDDIKNNPLARQDLEKAKKSERASITKCADSIAELLDGKVPDDMLKTLSWNIKWIVAGALNVGSINAALKILTK